MRLAVALALVIAFPTIAAAQYALQLRPSPYRVLRGWEQSTNTYRTQSVERVTQGATPVSDRAWTAPVGVQGNRRNGKVTGGIYRAPAPRN